MRVAFSPDGSRTPTELEVRKMARRTPFLLIAIEFLAVLSSSAVHAEEKVLGLSLQGSLGFGQVWSDESMLGAAVGPEASVEVLVLGKLGVQLGVSRYAHHRTFAYPSNVRISGESRMFSGDILYHFSGTRVQPFLLGGIAPIETRNRSRYPGFAYDGWLLLPRQIGEEVSEYTEHGGGLTFGGGVELPLSSSFAVRTEGRFVFPRKLSLSVGLSCRF
jgi:hypothetical protein